MTLVDAAGRDHPRSRGVYPAPRWAGPRCSGSSPLARGLRCGGQFHRLALGIIPARAGFTPARPAQQRRGVDHPRSRGVYGSGPQSPVLRPGSSPLARGLPNKPVKALGCSRIIPARAGFTLSGGAARRFLRDHPRSRGVYTQPTLKVRQNRGSSPLARGLQLVAARELALVRIIPARAGFTDVLRARPAGEEDHPRSRGVYSAPDNAARSAEGSSPLARGLPYAPQGRRVGMRIIPARAGFTGQETRVTEYYEDHPRSRGVYRQCAHTPTQPPGSSPLARGLPAILGVAAGNAGIIPARAGFTPSSPWRIGLWKDHPRSRGVYSKFALADWLMEGSSPLARGLR